MHEKQHEFNDEFKVPKESQISRRFISQTMQIVIILIFVTLTCLSFMQIELYTSDPSSFETGLLYV